MQIEQVIEALDRMHCEVTEIREKKREPAARHHKENTHVRPVNFDVGDFVLAAQREEQLAIS